MKVAPMREDPRGGASRRLVSPPRSYGEGPGVGFFGRRRMAFQASGSLARPTPGASPQEAGRGIAGASSPLPFLRGEESPARETYRFASVSIMRSTLSPM